MMWRCVLLEMSVVELQFKLGLGVLFLSDVNSIVSWSLRTIPQPKLDLIARYIALH
jgi:hypothetical protein